MYSVFESLFGPAGFQVVGVPTAEEALDVLAQRRPAALVTELLLGAMDGLTLLRQVRRERPGLPIIVCTEAPSAYSAAQALRDGADDYCLKRRDTATHLRATLRRAMRRRAHQGEIERLLKEIAELNDRFLSAMVELERENQALMERLRSEVPPPEGFRVLVVDDDVSIVAVLEALLRSQPGVDVVGLTHGAEARQALATQVFDLVLTDVQLGDDNGVDLAAWIHENRPSTAVALMTGFATVDSAVAAIREGVIGYLQKPFTDLDEVLGKVLEVKDKLEAERRQNAWMRAFHARNADFMARYRLLKTKLTTLQREST
jgi:DNA-binding NtrC family response regulator